MVTEKPIEKVGNNRARSLWLAAGQQALRVKRLSLKKIKEELKSKATPEEKKKFLEKAIASIDEKTQSEQSSDAPRAARSGKKKLEKLLLETNKNIVELEEEEKRLEEFAAERAAKEKKEAEEAELEAAKKEEPAAKYERQMPAIVPGREQVSGLERELVADRPMWAEAPAVPAASPHKEAFVQEAYTSHHIGGERILSTLVHYLRREGLNPQSLMTSSVEEQRLAQKVTEYFGGAVPAYQIQGYISSLRENGMPRQQAGEKGKEQKYTMKAELKET